MERSWYVRFGFLVLTLALGWFAFWPSVSSWLPAPAWVMHAFPHHISPGLDIRGGLRMMYEVEVDTAITNHRDRLVEQIEEKLGHALGVLHAEGTPTADERARIRAKVRVRAEGDRQIRITFTNAADASKLDRRMINGFNDLREVSRAGGNVLTEISPEHLDDLRDTAVRQAVEVIGRRIDELQIRETSVQARENDIVIEIPGANEADFNHIRQVIATTARLEFRIVEPATFLNDVGDLPEGITRREESEPTGNGASSPSAYLLATGPVTDAAGHTLSARANLQRYLDQLKAQGKVPEDHDLFLGEAEPETVPHAQRNHGQGAGHSNAWRTYLVQTRADVTGEYIEDAYVGTEPQSGRPVVIVKFDGTGAVKWDEVTGANTKRRVAIVLDGRVATAPVINERISGGNTQITLGSMGDYQQMNAEAHDLVVVLKAGALPAPIRPSNEQLIGPTLGRDSIQEGAVGAAIGAGLVLLFMLAYYEVAGVIADLAVMMNVLFLFSLLAFLEGTLTLHGVAGIALTVGMSVDANVLITERIREELRAGKSPRAAVDQGFGRAFSSIFDGHITTLISGVILFQYGTGPIKGFAVTLMIGIVTSLFTGVFCSRVMMDWVVRGLRVQRLRVG